MQSLKYYPTAVVAKIDDHSHIKSHLIILLIPTAVPQGTSVLGSKIK